MDTIITQLFNNQLKLDNRIGNINNTEVFEGTYNNNSKTFEVIVKMISKKDVKNFEEVLIEVGFLKYLSKFKTSSKYVSICYDIKLTKDYLIVILERPKGITLKQFLRLIKSLPTTEYNKLVCIIMFRLLLAVNYIHDKGVAHRNLTPDSIYIDYVDGVVESIKITDFAISCGNYVLTDLSTITLTNMAGPNNIYNKFCKTIKLDINAPETLKIDELVAKIKKLATDQTRESIYLYLAKKIDIWELGILFWKLLNHNSPTKNPLDLKFPKNYSSTSSWKEYKGHSNRLMKKIFKIVITLMLSEIPERGKSYEILEKFVILNKYLYDEDDNNNNNNNTN